MAVDPNKIVNAIYEKAYKNYDQTVKRFEKQIYKEYSTALTDIKQKIKLMYSQDFPATKTEMAKYNRLVNLEQQIADKIRSMTNESSLLLKDVIKDSFYKQYLYTGYAYTSVIKTKVTFGLLNSDVVEASIFNPVDRIKWTDRLKGNANNLNDKIKSAVTQGLIQGDGIVKTAKATVVDTALTKSRIGIERALVDRFGKNFNEVTRILRTETRRAQTQGTLRGFERAEQSAERLGIEVQRKIQSTLDSRTRRQSVIVDNRIANEKGLFLYPDGNYYSGPGLTGNLAWDINDRETVRMHFPEIPQKYRRENINEKEIIKNTNFIEWAQKNGITKSIYGEKYFDTKNIKLPKSPKLLKQKTNIIKKQQSLNKIPRQISPKNIAIQNDVKKASNINKTDKQIIIDILNGKKTPNELNLINNVKTIPLKDVKNKMWKLLQDYPETLNTGSLTAVELSILYKTEEGLIDIAFGSDMFDIIEKAAKSIYEKMMRQANKIRIGELQKFKGKGSVRKKLGLI